jgi:hypothetical protein
VAISAGFDQSIALQANGMVVIWGNTSLPEGTVPTNLFGVKGIAANNQHDLVIYSDSLPALEALPMDGFSLTNGSVTFSASGLPLVGVDYQWQLNGVNISGATSSTLTVSNPTTNNAGNYQLVIYNSGGSLTSSVATLTLVLPPQITPPLPGATWFANPLPLTFSAAVTAADQINYPLSYQWQFNGTNITGATSSSFSITSTVATNEGNYTEIITNAAGSTNVTWGLRFALPGMVEAWGDNASGECNRPASLTNVAAIAAGEYQSIALTDTGTVVQWGDYYDDDGSYFYSVTDYPYVSPPPTNNVVAVAAGLGQALALKLDGSLYAWGVTNAGGYAAYGTEVPSGLPAAKAIACDWYFDVALLTNGTVRVWGLDATNLGWCLT